MDKCNVCGEEPEYIVLLDAYGCACTGYKIVKEFFMPKLLKEFENEK